MQSRRSTGRTLATALLGLAALAAGHPAAAQAPAYPDKPVRLVVPFAPGGPTDLVARALGEALSRQVHQSVVVENRAGAGGVIGTGYVVNAPADGYTLLLGLQGPITINPALSKVPYDPFRDLVPVRMIATAPVVLMASRKSGVNTVREALALAGQRPGGLSFGSAGNGTLLHVGGELLKHEAKANLTHVPYKGAGPALVDLVAGHVDLLFSDLQVGLPYIQAGQVTALAVTVPTRSPKLPAVPTMAESGFPGVQLVGWYGMFAPRATPPAIVARIDRALQGALQDATFLQALERQGAQKSDSAGADFTAFLRGEYDQWQRLAKSVSITME